MDKLITSRPDACRKELVKMNKLAAAIYLTAQGIPFTHAGEEFLREKVAADGRRVENSYNAPDFVNAIRWEKLEQPDVAATVEYYKGLIAFRKAHASLRLPTAAKVSANVTYRWITNEVVFFDIKGKDSVAGEVSDGIIVALNCTNQEKSIDLYKTQVELGTWQVCVNAEKAGTEVLSLVTDGKITLPPISAMVLVKGKTK